MTIISQNLVAIFKSKYLFIIFREFTVEFKEYDFKEKRSLHLKTKLIDTYL